MLQMLCVAAVYRAPASRVKYDAAMLAPHLMLHLAHPLLESLAPEAGFKRSAPTKSKAPPTALLPMPPP